MHALRRFIQQGVDDRGWSQSDLARESGISKQVVSGLLTDPRERLDRLPQDKTVDGLARALGVDRAVVLTVIGEAMGLPMHRPVVVHDASQVADDDLVRVLAARLRAARDEPSQPAHADPRLPDDYAWAAREGSPQHAPDGATGEESQELP